MVTARCAGKLHNNRDVDKNKRHCRVQHCLHRESASSRSNLCTSSSRDVRTPRAAPCILRRVCIRDGRRMDALWGCVGTTMEWTTTSTTMIDDGCIDGNNVDDVNECQDRPFAYLTSSFPSSAISSFSGNLLTSLFIWRRNKFRHAYLSAG